MTTPTEVRDERAPLTPTRCIAAVVLAGLAVSVVANQAAYRDGEARVAASVAHLLFSGPTQMIAGTATFFVHAGRVGMFGLQITPACSSWPITAGFVAISAGLIAGSRFRLGRVAMAAISAIGVFALVNLLRVLVVAFATDRWGFGSGFKWSHVWVGSAITIAGAIAAFTAYLMVLGRGAKVFGHTSAGAVR